MELQDLACCGLKEISGVSRQTPELLIKELISTDSYSYYDYYSGKSTRHESEFNNDNLKTGAFIFTQAGSRAKYGDKLAAYIEEHGLGAVDVLPKFRNHNTGNHIKMFVWRFDYKALEKWYKAQATEAKTEA